MDLSEIKLDPLMCARGEYSTIKSKMFDATKQANKLRDAMISAMTISITTEGNEKSFHPGDMQAMLDEFCSAVIELSKLSEQRKELKPIAWPEHQLPF